MYICSYVNIFIYFDNNYLKKYNKDMNKAIDNIQRCVLDENCLNKVSEFFRIMGDNTRLNILIALSHRELCVSELVETLNISQSTISHQLKLLRTANLVKNRRDGRTIYYSLDDEHIANIVAMAIEHANENKS